jgi:hypothetical protein
MATLADIRVPQISRVCQTTLCVLSFILLTSSLQEELFAFHESHFSQVSIADFGANFTSLPEPANEEQQDEGAETQGAEIQVGAEVVDGNDYDPEASFDLHLAQPGYAINFEDGEIPDDEEGPENEKEQDKPRKKRRRKKNNTGNSNARRQNGAEPKKPDLRKRTWDVVDSGLGSLDYDGAERGGDSMQSAPQRRRVQYGDDCK